MNGVRSVAIGVMFAVGSSSENVYNIIILFFLCNVKTLKEKYLLIDQKYRMFEENYYANFKVFTIWNNSFFNSLSFILSSLFSIFSSFLLNHLTLL